MRKSIYTKFVIFYLIFAVVSFLFVSTKTSDMILDHLTTEHAETLYKEATLLSSTYAENYYRNQTTPSLETVRKHLNAVDTFLDAEIWMIDIDGRVIVESPDSFANSSAPRYLKNFDPTLTGNTYYMIGNFFGEFSEEVLSVIAPISYNYQVRGYMVIHSSMAYLEVHALRLLDLVYITVGVILLLSLVVLLLIGISIYSPMKKIMKGTDEYAAGHLTHQITLDTEDEFGQLAESMNYMARELNEMEEYQKKFVANISHDFRSPLTSIKGYVEAMKDGVIPVELQEKYFNIVLFETDRLNKLTKELLTLSSFDVKRGMLDITTFDINAIIKSTALTFEGLCTDRKITIELVFCSKQLQVKADMGKIQQVLYNLLDNAVKFSSDGSTIVVETAIKFEKVFVSVKDFGVGIPKDSLKKIWERFYKTDPSRGKDKRGTGLGLAIVKEIIQSHDENINVVSTEGIGSEFIFTLPKA